MPDDLTLSPQASAGEADALFDEALYLRAFPDVLDAVDRGAVPSGREHYLTAGRGEGRLSKPEYRRLLAARDRAPGPSRMESGLPGAPQVSVDALTVSQSGAILLVGWADDRHDRLTAITACFASTPYAVWSDFPRLRRPDVGRALEGSPEYRYGLWAFAAPPDKPLAGSGAECGECLIEFHFSSGARSELRRVPQRAGERELRDAALAMLAAMGQQDACSGMCVPELDDRIGMSLAEHGRSLTRLTSGAAVVEEIGVRRHRCRGSVIVLLDEVNCHPALHACLHAAGQGIEDYEFIYVANQPRQMAQLCREARVAERIYGLPHTLMLQPGEAGFGTTCNAAVALARSDRVVLLGPDVFPRDPDWARRHTDLLAAAPSAQTRLFGGALYSEDGSLRHAGLFFERDSMIEASEETVSRHGGLRIEAFGKGAPAWATRLTRPRPVPAVSGAFISIDRKWFEKLGGLSEYYHRGKYEDIDLCLRSLREGGAPWVHPIRMWQLDIGASTPPRGLAGGTLLNQWLFRYRWNSYVQSDLIGREPRHPLLRSMEESAPEDRTNGRARLPRVRQERVVRAASA